MLNVVDCHAEGESGKVVVGGVGDVPGHTMFDKRGYLQQNLDQLRELLLFEPRGAVWHNANIILPSNNPEASLGYVILESTEYPVMSGSNTMCVATVLLETGILPLHEPLTQLVLESPAGLIRVHCECRDGKVIRAKLYNQPAFVYYLDEQIDVPGLGPLRVDVAYGGMTYVLVNAADVGFDLRPDEARALCELGQRIKIAAAAQLAVSGPSRPGFRLLPLCQPLATLHLVLTEHRPAASGRAAIAVLCVIVGVVQVVLVSQFLARRNVPNTADIDAAIFILLGLAVRIAAVVEEHGGPEAVDDLSFATSKQVSNASALVPNIGFFL